MGIIEYIDSLYYVFDSINLEKQKVSGRTRRTFTVKYYDTEGDLLLVGYTSAFTWEEAQKRAPFAHIDLHSSKNMHHDDQIYFVI